jgi:1,4-dihydroxy-2-naphthoate octaprenyltransferase
MASSAPLTAWIAAARLRTLPLALSSIILGSLIARFHGRFSMVIMVLCMLTATLYQILSNYANDLGDGLKGTDANRIGEKRAVASGLISISEMKKAVILFAVLSLLSGSYLSWFATQHQPIYITVLFVGLGIAAVVAALKYTMGKGAYGYSGLGDVFVLLFFGWIGVGGAYFLNAKQLPVNILLPATAVGFLAVGVLNLNNLRDMENDARAGKRTLVVLLGRHRAKIYQTVLLGGALILQTAFTFGQSAAWGGYLFLATSPIILINLKNTWAATQPETFDPLLKPLAISTLLFCLLAGIGINL